MFKVRWISLFGVWIQNLFRDHSPRHVHWSSKDRPDTIVVLRPTFLQGNGKLCHKSRLSYIQIHIAKLRTCKGKPVSGQSKWLNNWCVLKMLQGAFWALNVWTSVQMFCAYALRMLCAYPSCMILKYVANMMIMQMIPLPSIDLFIRTSYRNCSSSSVHYSLLRRR